MTENDLDDLFNEARAQPVVVPAIVIQRVLADAQAEQARFRRPVAPLRNRWAALLQLVGGGGGLAGMATAALAGIVIGLVQPVEDGAIATLLGSEASDFDLMPGIEELLQEEP